MKEKLSQAKGSGVEDMSKLKSALAELEKKGEDLVSKQKDLEKKERVSVAEILSIDKRPCWQNKMIRLECCYS